MEEGIKLTYDHIQNLKIARIFEDNKKHITSLDFDESGSVCVTSSEDESIHVYDCLQGKLKQMLFSKKYGVNLVRFTHRSTNIIHTSTKNDDTIRYLSLHDNKYLQYFRGHKRKVVSLEMSPLDDHFLAGSVDDCIKLWDLRSPNCQASMNITGSPCIAFDPQGQVFAIGINSRTLKLYSMKEFHKGPFLTAIVAHPHHRSVEWSRMTFSNDGNHILIATRQDVHFLVNSYSGALELRLTGHVNQTGIYIDATFTPDSQYIISGSQDGTIHFWDAHNGREVQILEGHPNSASIVQFNPKYLMMASACTNLAFWTPDYEAMEESGII